MRVRVSPDLISDLRKIKRKDAQLIKLVEKQLELFSKNPKHPSLRLHKLTGKLDNRFSISINQSIRMVYIQTEHDIAYFFAIGTHDQVYRKKG